jgi:hypothetical protein
MKLAKKYTTRLEATEAKDIVAVLEAKLEATSPERVVDYVALAVDNLEAQIARMKEAEEELKYLKADAQLQIDTIKTGTALWLTESGVDKLDGDIVSSMKITQPKAKEELVITTDSDSLINQGYFKTSLDKTAIKNAILDGVEVDGASIEVTHQTSTLTIYKKRAKKDAAPTT